MILYMIKINKKCVLITIMDIIFKMTYRSESILVYNLLFGT